MTHVLHHMLTAREKIRTQHSRTCCQTRLQSVAHPSPACVTRPASPASQRLRLGVCQCATELWQRAFTVQFDCVNVGEFFFLFFIVRNVNLGSKRRPPNPPSAKLEYH